MFSPEHSSTRDEAVAESVPCPPPWPEVAPPPRGALVIVATGRIEDGVRPDADGVEQAEAFSLATVIEPGETASRIALDDRTTQSVDNARLIELSSETSVPTGAMVLAVHPEVGAMRGVVTSASPTVARRLQGFGSGRFGEQTLKPGTFRRLENPLDPGSLVALPLADRVGLAMVVGGTETLLVVADDEGTLRAVHRTAAIPVPLDPAVEPGDRVFAPFVGDLDEATVKTVSRAAAHAEVFRAWAGSENASWVGFGAILTTDVSLGVYSHVRLTDGGVGPGGTTTRASR